MFQKMTTSYDARYVCDSREFS